MVKEQKLSDKEQEKQIVQVIQSKEAAPNGVLSKLNRAQVDLLKRTIAKGASDDEIKLFLEICKGTNLNPFLHQAHLVPFWDSKAGVDTRVIIVGIDGKRAIAEESGNYAGSDDPIYVGETELEIEEAVYKNKVKTMVKRKLKVPDKATVTVYKIVQGVRCPFVATARWNEYFPKKETNRGRWHAMPYLMIGKCAEALALRKAFPKLLSGIYSPEEMDQASERPEQKSAKAMTSLITLIKKATGKEIEELMRKMDASDKYSKEQKQSFVKAASDRLQELNGTKNQKVVEGVVQ